MFSTQDYDYDLPENRIAQKPSRVRDGSRLLWLRRKNGGISHHRFKDLSQLLLPTDLLVVNNTRVIPARLVGQKESGGRVELLLLNDLKTGAGGVDDIGNQHLVYECLVKASKRPKDGSRLLFGNGYTAKIVGHNGRFSWVRFNCKNGYNRMLQQIGSVPLPPYIKRDPGRDEMDDKAAYQTVYARHRGAVAAPTAGLHFSHALLNQLKKKGIQIVEITLHVGYGTFSPVQTSDIRDHRLHQEQYRIPPEAAGAINRAMARGHRVVAVGTTCVRTLEFMTDKNGVLSAGEGWCDLFIYPGYRFKTVDAVITNFHLPKSTLLMLVSAFSSRERILSAYQEAIAQEYRFYSYGDAMFIG
ncbi:MAG: tRNA preQ1(34) S-adenosylmethionine ribosyltransferase-isomerase QueA [Deltaproteobacteria bacterium]|nr:tRNA preQ1(34) S-adenosylmethionine ribosyltransferase-isomerase QueA [Deltaproteobacteria bacterium]